jgi:hypothetical protein
VNFIISLLAGLASSALVSTVVKRVVIALGITAITYTGIGAALDAVSAQIAGSYGGLAADTLAFLALAKIPNAVNLILSAYAARLVLQGLSATGGITRWVKGAGS